MVLQLEEVSKEANEVEKAVRRPILGTRRQAEELRAARSPVFYGSSRISGRSSRLPFETNTGDTFSRILTYLKFVT